MYRDEGGNVVTLELGIPVSCHLELILNIFGMLKFYYTCIIQLEIIVSYVK